MEKNSSNEIPFVTCLIICLFKPKFMTTMVE
uniref:Uncharacterized protein n=1 Tax=Anguilla anguilla TaxID=7936 RepID=A0A0E9QZQ5_ANGAN